jgi:hypothetical protein
MLWPSLARHVKNNADCRIDCVSESLDRVVSAKYMRVSNVPCGREQIQMPACHELRCVIPSIFNLPRPGQR